MVGVQSFSAHSSITSDIRLNMIVVPTSTVRPRARRQRGLNVLTDLEVWSYDASEIIGMHLASLHLISV